MSSRTTASVVEFCKYSFCPYRPILEKNRAIRTISNFKLRTIFFLKKYVYKDNQFLKIVPLDLFYCIKMKDNHQSSNFSPKVKLRANEFKFSRGQINIQNPVFEKNFFLPVAKSCNIMLKLTSMSLSQILYFCGYFKYGKI